MAEGCYEEGSLALFYGGRNDGSWWGWIQSAGEKVVSQSTEVLEFVKKDFDEFTKVVSEEASSVVSSTANTLKEKLKLDDDESTASNVKKSVSGFLNHVAEVFTPPPDDGDQEAIVIRNQQPVILNRLQAAIYAISQDPETFTTDPEGEETQYETWVETFDLEARQTELSDLLVNNQPLRHHYTTLVPAQVSHVVFWHRYFYKVSRLEAAEARRQELKQRAEKTNTESELVWDEDEDFGGDVEIPEEVQTKLLEDYERECEENGMKRLSKTASHLDTAHKTASADENVDVPNCDSDLSVKATACTKSIMEELKVDLSKMTEATSKPSPASTESNEDEWEKVDASEAASTQVTPAEKPEKVAGTEEE
ncbi:BSD domain-containing protein 1 isoform X3 [Penaeus vannamei]|uniref:BSD domain-containing protein 1 isoform X3 n=1 Tax=Penaeus vannamei TaxID=6689 RepID=UPI00387FA6AF